MMCTSISLFRSTSNFSVCNTKVKSGLLKVSPIFLNSPKIISIFINRWLACSYIKCSKVVFFLSRQLIKDRRNDLISFCVLVSKMFPRYIKMFYLYGYILQCLCYQDRVFGAVELKSNDLERYYDHPSGWWSLLNLLILFKLDRTS